MKRVIRRDNNDALDEVVIEGDIAMFHIEMLDDNAWWLAVYMTDGLGHHFNLYSKKPIEVMYEPDNYSAAGQLEESDGDRT